MSDLPTSPCLTLLPVVCHRGGRYYWHEPLSKKPLFLVCQRLMTIHFRQQIFHGFYLSIFLVAVLVLLAALMPDTFSTVVQRMIVRMEGSTDWIYLTVVFLALIFLLYLAFGRFANLHIGGRNAEPDFSNGSWFAMMFSAGMGIGLMFWGVAEPISHLMDPPEGITPDTVAAAEAAMRYSFFHWGLHPWAIYALVGLTMAWFQHSLRGRGLISDMLQPVLGRHHKGPLGAIVNIIAVIATAAGVATTLGFGTAQIAAGMEHVFGVRDSRTLELIILAVAFVCYMASSASGVGRGVKWLSNANLVLAGLLLLAVLVVGPTGAIFETLTSTLGGYLNNLVTMSLHLTPFDVTDWVARWTIFCWAWWIAWCPLWARSLRGFHGIAPCANSSPAWS